MTGSDGPNGPTPEISEAEAFRIAIGASWDLPRDYHPVVRPETNGDMEFVLIHHAKNECLDREARRALVVSGGRYASRRNFTNTARHVWHELLGRFKRPDPAGPPIPADTAPE